MTQTIQAAEMEGRADALGQIKANPRWTPADWRREIDAIDAIRSRPSMKPRHLKQARLRAQRAALVRHLETLAVTA